jgi:hypothetical protein
VIAKDTSLLSLTGVFSAVTRTRAWDVAGPVTAQLVEPDDDPLVTDAAMASQVEPPSRLKSTRTRACAPSVCVHDTEREEPTVTAIAVFGDVTVIRPEPEAIENEAFEASVMSVVDRRATTRMRPLLVIGPGAAQSQDRAEPGSAAQPGKGVYDAPPLAE